MNKTIYNSVLVRLSKYFLAVVFVIYIFSSLELYAITTIKLACLAPEGSLWVNLTKDWDKELRQRTQNQAKIQIFPGGVLGEEIDTIRKMRAGQIHATGVTGIGMGEMVGATRVFELPRLFKSYAELDAAEKRLEGYFVDAFQKKGFVFLGFTEVGPIHMFSKKPIYKTEELVQRKMWVWESDPISQEIARVFRVSSVPLSVLNVLPSLQTGLIDAIYGSPLAVVTMQWSSYIKYMVTEPLAYAIGVMAMDKKAFDSLPQNVQSIQMELGKKYTRKMVEQSRLDNAKSVELLKSKNIQLVSFNEKESQSLEEKAKQTWTFLQKQLYTQELLTQVQGAALSVRGLSK